MDSSMSQTKCGYCEKDSPNMESCSKCHLTTYCSTQCQRRDWERHKKWCEILQGNPNLQQGGNLTLQKGGNVSYGSAEGSEAVHNNQRADNPIQDPNGTLYSEGPYGPPGEDPKDVNKKESEVPRGNPYQVLKGSSNGSEEFCPPSMDDAEEAESKPRAEVSNGNSQAGKKKRRKKKQGTGEARPEPSKCSWCKKMPGNALKCSRCKSRTYCSDVCQRRDWVDGHQKACQSVDETPSLQMTKKEEGENGSTHSKSAVSEANVCDWCQKCLESPLRCTGCGKVKYCSKTCQKKDWDRQHKRNCERKIPKNKQEPEMPVRQGTNGVPNGAKKRVDHETTPIEDDPTDLCDWCQKYLDSPLRCSGCKKAKYCSAGCQKKDWTRQHKDNCDKTFVPKKNGKTTKATRSEIPELDKNDEPPTSCNWCQKFVEDSFPCDMCSNVIYCSNECKNKDWFREHKNFCDGKENKRSAKSRSNPEDSEGGKDRCQNCNKRTKDVKRCARCKIAKYCSKSCQIQNWKQHKGDCITVDGVIKTKEYQKAVEEEEARARRRDVPMSPLEAMAQMMGMYGRPQPEVKPRMSWRDAKDLTRLRFPGFQIVEDLEELPGEFLWMVPQTHNKVLLAFICRRHHHFARHAVYIKDAFGQETAVMFYLHHDNPLPFFTWGYVAPGNYICIRNAIFHNFMDGSVGIRVNEAADVKILS